MDERASQFFLSVGRLCDDARIAGLTVRVWLAGGEELAGVPGPPLPTEGADELDAIGYADAVTIGGVDIALSDVVEASVVHPARRPDGA